MDVRYEFNGTSFMWNAAKATTNARKHGVTFEQAAQVFFDPLFQLVDAGRNDESRDRKGSIMISDAIKARLSKDRAMTSITLRIPVDVVDSLKAVAPCKGFAGYQGLLKAYISDGLRRDEIDYQTGKTARLLAALKERGVPDSVLEEAQRAAA